MECATKRREHSGAITVHGRYSSEFARHNYLPVDRFVSAARAYRERGFEFVDYSDQPSDLTGEYGVTLSSPAFVTKCLEPDHTIRQLAWIERGWNEYQDIVVIQKAPLFRLKTC